jgi:hypothetical protein
VCARRVHLGPTAHQIFIHLIYQSFTPLSNLIFIANDF